MSSKNSAVADGAMKLHQRSIVIDALDVSHFDRSHLEKMHAGGITACNATVAMPGANFRQSVDAIRDFDTLIEANSDIAMHAVTAADIEKAKAAGKVAIVYGFQNAVGLEGDPKLVKVFHALGVSIIQLTYMTANVLGDGCLEPRNGGLTVFGKAVVRELNKHKIIIDLSHVGERTSLDAIEYSATPVAISHACAKGLVNNPRNKSDEVIKAVVARGGTGARPDKDGLSATAYPSGVRGTPVEMILSAAEAPISSRRTRATRSAARASPTTRRSATCRA